MSGVRGKTAKRHGSDSVAFFYGRRMKKKKGGGP
jgi:hypothetical protein